MGNHIELELKIVAFVISFLLLIKGIYEYKWKRAEFVAKEIKEFYEDFDIKRGTKPRTLNSLSILLTGAYNIVAICHTDA